MAKRSAEERKEPTKQPCTVQSTIFQPGQGSSSFQKPCIAEETPQSYGIYTYTEADSFCLDPKRLVPSTKDYASLLL